MNNLIPDLSVIVEMVSTSLGTTISQPKIVRLGSPIKFSEGARDPIRASVSDESDQPGMIWVHFEDDNKIPQAPFLVLNSGQGRIPNDHMIYRQPIWIRRLDSTTYIASGVAPRESAEYMFGVTIHTQTGVDISQIQYFQIRPTDPPSMQLQFTGGYPVLDGKVYQLLPVRTSSLLSLIPGSLNQAKGIRVAVDPTTGLFDFLEGSLYTFNHVTNVPDHIRGFPHYPTTLSGDLFLLGWVRLYYGMSSIGQSDILPAQELVGRSTRGSGVTQPVTYCGVPIYYQGEQVFYTP